MSTKISAVIIAKNEEKNIVDCLESLEWCDEIIVIDDDSSDRTHEVAESKGAKVFKRKLEESFSEQRNFGLEKASFDWVLFIDADERISPELAREIQSAISNESVDGYFLRRKDVIWGKQLNYGDSGNIKLLRLGKRGRGKWVGRAHEEWRIEGNKKILENSLIHYPHQTISEFLEEINLYTSLRAKDLYDKKLSTNAFLIIAYPLGKFLNNYFLKKGYKDGIEGFIFAIFMSLHSFLVRSKLWLLWQKK